MKCPKCKTDMKLVTTDVSYRDDGTAYNRGIYHCATDDVWVVVEIPQKQNLA